MIRTFFGDVAAAYRDGWTLARALPWLVLAMAGIELAQHAVEWRLGFFAGDAALHRQAATAPLRMAFGWPKMLTLYAVGFIAIRWCVLRDPHRALRPPPQALRRYVWVVLFQLVPAVAIIQAGSFAASASGVMAIRLTAGLAQQLSEPLLCLWFVHAALGSRAFGPLASAKTTRWLYVWALLLVLIARVPASQLHARLNIWSAGQAPAMQAALLLLDAAVVGLLAVIVPAAQVRASRRIAARRGIALTPDGAMPSP